MAESRNDSKVGQSATRLAAGLKRSQWLPHYDRATLRDIVAEMGELFKHLHHNLDMNRIEGESDTSGNNPRTATISFLDAALRRNRQCVLVYLNYRLEAVQELAWQHIGRHDNLPEQIKDRLDAEEVKYCNQYNTVLDRYMSDFNSSCGDDAGEGEFQLDILTDTIPPKGPLAEVQLKVPYDDRPAGSRFSARRQLVEPLVLSGKAIHINSDTRSGGHMG